jgi:EAL domain-containing protein (putative c-di-GMP-specific phosphodiesterase class I)
VSPLTIDVRIQPYAPIAMNAHKHASLTDRLKQALEREELSVCYQPQYRSADGSACGVEALARWHPPSGLPIAPTKFIRHAEQVGLIGALGEWVLRQACETAASWSHVGKEPPVVCVNVSPRQIGPEFLRILVQNLACAKLAPSRLELEITEGIVIKDPVRALEWLNQWKELGVRIALDDFGTGYSSLDYLSRMPVDRVKIDRSLIQRVVADAKTASIVRAVISLGQELGFAVLAEGVETEAQFELLLRMGCEQMQGFLLAVPVPSPKVESLLARPWGSRIAKAFG